MAKPSYVANYLPGLIEEGHSGASALRTLRDNGLSIKTQTFYRLWGETKSHLAKAEQFVSAPLNRRPSVDEIGIATRPRARGYLYNVEIAAQDPITGEVSFHSWGVRSQRLISVGAALRKAVDSWTAAQEGERGSPEGRALGGTMSNILQLVGPDDSVDE